MTNRNPPSWQALRQRARIAARRYVSDPSGGQTSDTPAGPGDTAVGTPGSGAGDMGAVASGDYWKNFVPDFGDNPLGELGDKIGEAYDTVTDCWDKEDTTECIIEAYSDPDEKGHEIGTKEAQKEARFIEQCFLTHEIERLSTYNLNIGKPEGYEHFVSVPGEPWRVVNEFASRKDLLPLFRLKPVHMALLMPKIRLFKVVCEGGKETEVEFPFEQNWGVGAFEFGVGIKDVKVNWLGTTDADVNRTVEVEMTFIAATSEDLFAVRHIDGHEISVADMIMIRRKAQDPLTKGTFKDRIIQASGYRIKAILGWSAPTGNATLHLPSEPDILNAVKRSRLVLDLTLVRNALSFNQDGSLQMRVKYVSRLDAIQGLTSADVFQDNKTLPLKRLAADQRRRKKIAKRRKRRLESAIKHQQEGSYDKARAEIDKLLESTDDETILGVHRDEWEELKENIESDEAAQSLEGSRAGAEQQENQFDNTAKATLEAAKVKEKQELTKKYNRIINSLYEKGYLYYIDVPEETIGIWEGNVQLKREEVIKEQGFDTLDIAYEDPRQLKGDEPVEIKEQQERNNDAAEEAEEDWWKGWTDWLGGDRTSTDSQSKPQPREGLKPGHYRINYFYLGSLLEVAYELAKENHKSKVDEQKKRIDEDIAGGDDPSIDAECLKSTLQGDLFESLIPIMGPIVIQPRRVVKKGDGETLTPPPSNNNPIIKQLIDIPLSLKLFLELFNKKIVSKGVKSLPLQNFLNLIFREMVQPVMSAEGCVEDGSKSFGILRVHSLSSQAAKGGEPRIKRTGRAKLSEVKKSDWLDPEGPLIRKYFQHQITLIADASPNYIHFGKDEEEDATKRGIYHFYMALDRGMIKSIDFTRSDIPYFIAAQVTGEQSSDLKYVKEYYNAKITMYGNTIFKPGSKIMINPLLPSMGSILSKGSPARKLGLGGLYSVINAQYLLSETGFETILDARWIAFPANKDAASPVVEEQIERIEDKPRKMRRKRAGGGSGGDLAGGVGGGGGGVGVGPPIGRLPISDRIKYKKQLEAPD